MLHHQQKKYINKRTWADIRGKEELYGYVGPFDFDSLLFGSELFVFRNMCV